MDDKTLYRFTFETYAGTYYYLIECGSDVNLAGTLGKIKDYHEKVMADAEKGGFLDDDTYPACCEYRRILVEEIIGCDVTGKL